VSKKLMLLLLGLLTSHLGATTYYVAKTGNDASPGTEAEPWLTIGHAATLVAAGDTCWVKAGVYAENVNFNGNAGTMTDPIVFRSFDGWQTIITGYVSMNEKHYGLEGFRLIYSACPPYEELKFYVDSCALRYCDIGPVADTSFDSSNGVLNTGDGTIIAHNRVHGFGGNGAGHGIYSVGSYVTITNNEVYNNCRIGIQAYPSIESCEIAYNVCNDNGSDGLLLWGNHNRVHHNICYDNGYNGIRSYAPDGHNNEISNNVCYGNGISGIWIWDTLANTARNNICVNNNADVAELILDTLALPHGLEINYNCYYSLDGTPTINIGAGHGSGGVSFAVYQSATGQDAQGMAADPLFVDTAARNFRLAAGSPCIDAGDPATPPGFDFDGTPTPQGTAVDMGAYEYHTFDRTRDSGRDTSLLAVSSAKTLAIAPNPQSGGRGAVRYSLPKAGSATLEVFNTSGRLVHSSLAPAAPVGQCGIRNSEFRLDLRSMPAGVYLVRVTAEGFSTTQKLVVEH
jgi:parallel beta-helix repeat protein